MSAPSSNGFTRYAVATVLSITRGIWYSCASSDNASISITSSLGFPIVSANITLVLSFTAALTASRSLPSTKFVFIPKASIS